MGILRKLASVVLTLLMLISFFVVAPSTANAAGGVESKLNAIKNVYPTGSYFTASGKPCYSNQNSDCELKNIPSRGGLPSGATAAKVTYNAWSCCSFARYVFYCIFGLRPEACTSVSGSNLKIGDYIYMNRQHYAIYLGQDSNYWYVYNSNGTTTPTNKVEYNQKYLKSKWKLTSAYHATNYDKINGTTPHTHNFSTISGYEAAHPHYAIKKCSCGATQTDKSQTSFSGDCSTCLSGLSSSQTISDGEYHIVSAINNDYCLSIYSNLKTSGANVHLWKNTSFENTCALVNVKHLGSGYYSLTFKHSGMAIDTCGAGKTNGTNVQQYTPNSTNAQKWIIKQAGNGYFNIISKCSGLYLDAKSGVAENGTNIQVYNKNGTNAQKWKFIASGVSFDQTVYQGDYHIVSSINNSYGLSVSDNSTSSGANVQLGNNMEDTKSLVKVKYLGTGRNCLVFKDSKMAMDSYDGAYNNGTISGSNVKQYWENTTDAQQWIMEPAGDGCYYIVSRLSGLCLDIKGGDAVEGNNIQMAVKNGSRSQKWKFISDDSTAYRVSRLYVDNSAANWDNVYVFGWGYGIDNETLAMTNIIGTDIWYIDLPHKLTEGLETILFKNTPGSSSTDWDKQSKNVIITKPYNCYKLNSLSLAEGIWYKYTEPTTSNTPTESPTTAKPTDNSNPDKFSISRIFADNSLSNWNEVYLYGWSNGLDNTKAYPMTNIEGTDYWYIDLPQPIPEGTEILFKNTPGAMDWDKQTMNTAVTVAYNCYEISPGNLGDGKWKVYNGSSSEPESSLTTPSDTTEPTESTELTSPSISSSATSGDFEYEIYDNGTAQITGYKGSNAELEIPDTLDGYTVTVIGDWAFKNYTSLKSITIPDSVTSINSGAFDGCTSLKSVTIGNGVTNIGEWAFHNCTSLKSIKIPKSVTNIGYNALGFCYDYENGRYFYVDNFTITGYSTTEAERYAEYHDIKFINIGTDIKLEESSATVYVKGTAQIKAAIKKAKGKTTYKTSNKKVANVNSSGKVTGVKKGTATITVTNNGVSKRFKITVKNPKLNKTKKSLKKGKSFKLSIKGKVGNAKFTSSNKKVATVSKKGNIKAKKKGKATITVKTNGMRLKCKITVR